MVGSSKNRHYFPVAIECGLISPAPRVEASMEDIKSKFHLRDSLLAFCMGVRAGLAAASMLWRRHYDMPGYSGGGMADDRQKVGGDLREAMRM